MYSVTFELPSAELFERFMNVIRHYGFLQFMTSSQKVHPQKEGGGSQPYKVPDAFTRKNMFL